MVSNDREAPLSPVLSQEVDVMRNHSIARASLTLLSLLLAAGCGVTSGEEDPAEMLEGKTLTMTLTNASGQDACPFDTIEVSETYGEELNLAFDTSLPIIEANFTNLATEVSAYEALDFGIAVRPASANQSSVPITMDAAALANPGEEGYSTFFLSFSTEAGGKDTTEVVTNAVFLVFDEGDLSLATFAPADGKLEGTFEVMGTCRRNSEGDTPVTLTGTLSIK